MMSNKSNSVEFDLNENDTRYDKITDEQLIDVIKETDDKFALDCLINRYRNFVRAKARTYFLIGADSEDIIQEGMIGLFKAIRDFQKDKRTSFRVFADLCVTRQIITAIKASTRQKHMPLNSYVSLNKPLYDERSEYTFFDTIPTVDKLSSPEEAIITQEDFEAIEKTISEVLSELEWQVLVAYLDGKSYQEISIELNRHVKSIDNALQRVKRKIERYTNNNLHSIDVYTIYRGFSALVNSMKPLFRSKLHH